MTYEVEVYDVLLSGSPGTSYMQIKYCCLPISRCLQMHLALKETGARCPAAYSEAYCDRSSSSKDAALV